MVQENNESQPVYTEEKYIPRNRASKSLTHARIIQGD